MSMVFGLFVFCRTSDIWKFLGQGLNSCHSSDPNHCIVNPLFHKKTPDFFFFFFLLRATLVAYGDSQESKLWPLAYTTAEATPDPSPSVTYTTAHDP